MPMLALYMRAILTRLPRIRTSLRIHIALLRIGGILLTGMICLGGLHLDARAQADSDQMVSLSQDVVGLSAGYLEAGLIANEFLRKHDESLIGRHERIVEAALVVVEPAHTSQTCFARRAVDSASRIIPVRFACTKCGA